MHLPSPQPENKNDIAPQPVKHISRVALVEGSLEDHETYKLESLGGQATTTRKPGLKAKKSKANESGNRLGPQWLPHRQG